jgi:hypothetical protein
MVGERRMITEEQAGIVKGLLARGEKQHDIAAFFGVNGGRIAEIAKGKKFPDVSPAAKRELPTPAVMVQGYAAHVALQALRIIEIAVQSAIARIAEQMGAPDKGSKH